MIQYHLDSRKTFRATAAAPAPRPPRPTPQRPRGPLSKAQKAELSIGFRKAWTLDGAQGSADDFRRAAVVAATGKAGLTACAQDDYLKCKAKIAELMGEDGEAMNHHIADQATGQRVAHYKLQEALRKSGKPLAYAEAISRRRWKVTVAELSDKQIWQLIYTINNR